jgi:alpha-tubulin suppressor-like RCC1 family protein
VLCEIIVSCINNNSDHQNPMPKLTLAEKLERKQRLEEKREAKRFTKELNDQDEAAAAVAIIDDTTAIDTAESSSTGNISNHNNDNDGTSTYVMDQGNDAKADGSMSESITTKECILFTLSDDSFHHILWYLSARDLGALTLTGRSFSRYLVGARASYVWSRLHWHPTNCRPGGDGEDSCISRGGTFQRINMCQDKVEAHSIVDDSYGGGDTGRLVARGKTGKDFVSEFVSYARFLEEAVCGYAELRNGTPPLLLLPPFVNGRFVSTSPEHSLVRVGGGGISGAGGSGVASWGVGARGQLGHGKRQDEKHPKPLLGGIGYGGIRIVQVAAGGGLVRVAHSLLLTSTGRVLSFGSGQYGALGHGFSGGKQLPDILRPKYIEALADVRCVCVAAGELHSSAVTEDGDCYTWGDGFCGQLGHADKRPQVSPVQVTRGGLEDESISHVSCGARHTLAVTEDGECYSWGLGHYGVLGRSFTPYDHEPDAALTGLGGDDELEVDVAAPLQVDDFGNVVAQRTNNDEIGNPYNFDDLMAHLDLIANLSLVDSSDQCIPMQIDSLAGIKIVGASAGHRHSLFLDDKGGLYSCGAGITGCLGHGDKLSQMVPMRINAFDDDGIKILQMSAGVDMSMAVTTTGDVYSWGKTDGGRIGLGLQQDRVTKPRRVRIVSEKETPVKAVDVECGYVHSIIVGLNGTIHVCGGVGVDGEADGQHGSGQPVQEGDFNIWHRIKEPTEQVKTERWKKYGKYEVKGRSKTLAEE